MATASDITNTAIVNPASIPVAAPTHDEIDKLAAQIKPILKQINAAKAEAAEFQRRWDTKIQCTFLNRGKCNCGGGKTPCNNFLDGRNAANSRAKALQEQYDNLNKQLADAQIRYDAAVKAFNDNAVSQVALNPELAALANKAKIDAQALSTNLQLADLGNKKIIIIAVVIVVVAAITGFIIYKVRKSKAAK